MTSKPLLFLIIITLFGCGDESMDLAKGEQVCEHNGELYKLYYSIHSHIEVVCKDGTSLSFNNKEWKEVVGEKVKESLMEEDK